MIPMQHALRAHLRRTLLFFSLLLISSAAFSQSDYEVEPELLARQRVFPAVGPGLQAVARGSEGRYYVLTTLSRAVSVYDSTGKPIGQVPEHPRMKAPEAIVSGVSLDADDGGRLVVADAGDNAVKVYAADGSLVVSFNVAHPLSVALLPSGEIAVTSQSSDRLICVYNSSGKLVRAFGSLEDLSDRSDLNHLVNVGWLGRDATANLYIAFEYFPEPTVRKYDPHGSAILELSLGTLDFQPAAQAARREIAREEPGGALSPHQIITGMGIDQATGEVWLSFGSLLMHFDKDGNRLESYRTYTPYGAHLEATTILVEPNRLLLGQDPLGVYEFDRPDKPDKSEH